MAAIPALQAASAKNERRLRLQFTSNLASGAFGDPAPNYYVVTSLDGKGADTVVTSAIALIGYTNLVDLTLSLPLTSGGLYQVSAIGVPLSGSDTSDGTSILSLQWVSSSPLENKETTVAGNRKLLYFVDLVWNGSDFQESGNGDLAQITGPANVAKALNKAVLTNPGDLHWDTSHGAGAREFVDSPSTAVGSLKSAVATQILRDPRVASVKMTYEIDDVNTILYATPTLVTGELIDRISVVIPND